MATVLSGMQEGVIVGAQPYGLGLNETILPQYLRTLGYKTHIVGKVPFSKINRACKSRTRKRGWGQKLHILHVNI